VILMGMRNLAEITGELVAGGRSPDTPAAAVMHGTLPEQRTCVSTLGRLAEDARAAGLSAPTTIVVGEVVGLREGLSWWETQPMFGRRVLVTRAREQVDELAFALRARGAIPVVVPMIELVPIDSPEGRDEISAALSRLAGYRTLVFTSSNAVRFFARALSAKAVSGGPDPRSRFLGAETRTFCIGEATARAALEEGLPVHVTATGRGDSEALLAQLLQALPDGGGRVLIPRSDIARTVIADGLREAGAEVDSIAFYENRRPDIDPTALRDRLLGGELDALTFTSPSTVDHFLECLDDASRAAAGQCIIAAIGRTTARRLAEVGLPADVVPDRPEASEMADALATAAWPVECQTVEE
jgi:uroporphyrinogen III methyltransferase/synthase